MNLLTKSIAYVIGAGACFSTGYLMPEIKSGNFSAAPLKQLVRSPKAETEKVSATQLFQSAFTDIQKSYFRPIDAKELKYAAMEGALSSLGDPHTVFMEPKVSTEFRRETGGQNDFVGIGARLQPDPQGAKIVSVFKNTPANKSGVLPGDVIMSVDGVKAAGTEIDKLISRIRGKEGTPVKIEFLRPRTGETLIRNIVRGKVLTPTADGYMLEGKRIAYVQVFQFAETTAQQFGEVVDELDKLNPKGLIIDLRGNPGGLLEIARDMLSRFIEDKVIVVMKRRDGGEETVIALNGAKKAKSYPVMILQNEESASASEIFAGVMHDYKLATLVGDHSYGKASVQNLYALPDGGAVKVTVAKYYLPSGKDIMRTVDEDGHYLKGGLMPDVEVRINLGPNTTVGDPKTDNQLQKAIQLIEERGPVGLLQPNSKEPNPSAIEVVVGDWNC